MQSKSLPLLRALLGAAMVVAAAAQAPAPASPLSFRIGAFDFTPSGFLDFTTVFRSTAVGSGIGTNFAAIPYSDTVAGRLTELRLSAQNSRLALTMSGRRAGTDLTAYVETDFLGNQPANIAVTSNSATLRLRVYMFDARHGAWEVLAGQDWSLLAPSRAGIAAMTGDVFYTLNMDANYQAGLAWARQPQLRVVYHASPKFSAAVSAEQGEPYIGGSAGAPTVVLPGGTSGPYAGQVDNGASSYSAPGFTPDLVAKVAYDSRADGHGLHLEAAGLASTFRIFTPASNTTDHATGGGLALAGNLEVAHGMRLVASSFWGDGGGRYFFGTAPDLVIRNNGQISLVRSGGGIAGVEDEVSAATTLTAYYGGLYILPSFDLSGTTPVGYGFPGASNDMNRSIQEATLGLIRTFWKSPQYGALQLITQASYLTRAPYEVAAGTPKNAHTGMGYVDLRFTLP